MTLRIDSHSGIVSTADGSVILNPTIEISDLPNPSHGTYPARKIFEVDERDGVKVVGAIWNMGDRLTLGLTATHERFGLSWDDWSQDKEHARLQWLTQWLEKVGVPIGTYTWGTVSASYDPKGGGSSAGIVYGVSA